MTGYVQFSEFMIGMLKALKSKKDQFTICFPVSFLRRLQLTLKLIINIL